jgi:hypothetical protein
MGGHLLVALRLTMADNSVHVSGWYSGKHGYLL